MTGRTPGGSQASLREANRTMVVDALRLAGALTQAEIARRTGLSPATVSNIVRDLRRSGSVAVSPTSRTGRRALEVTLTQHAGVAVGLDFGHSHVRVAVSDLSHEVLAEEERFLDVDGSADAGLGTAVDMVTRLLAEIGAQREQAVGIGVGVPGPIDVASGTIDSATIMPGWQGVSAVPYLQERLGIPVHLDNDANLGALAELIWGAGQGCRNLVYIKLATGVGAGLVLDEQVYRGRSGTAGEIGHMPIESQGRICRCGNRGCLETLVGVPALLEMLRPRHGEDLTVRGLIALAAHGDIGCERVLGDAGRSVGIAVAGLCNMLNPERIIVGGELGAAGEMLLGPLRDVVRRNAIPAAAAGATIVPGVLGERAEVLGGLALVLREARHLGGTPVLSRSRNGLVTRTTSERSTLDDKAILR